MTQDPDIDLEKNKEDAEMRSKNAAVSVEIQSKNAKDSVKADVDSEHRASAGGNRKTLDQAAIEQWRKVYISMHGS